MIFGAVSMDVPDNRQFSSEAWQELYILPVTGGRVQQVLTTSAEYAKKTA